MATEIKPEVELWLDADHAAALSRAIGAAVLGEDWWDIHEDRAVLLTIREIITEHLAEATA